MIILDTDFASVLAKAEIIGLIKKLFSGKHDIIITPKVYDELKVPKEYGYSYPDKIFKNVDVLTVESQEQELYMGLLSTNPALGRGELESIAVCINRAAIFATLDDKAKQFAKDRGIHVLHIHTVLKMLLKTGLCSESDIMGIVKKIEKTDKRIIKLEFILAQA
jgi:predicted nucleic acid-binding protein